MVERRIGSGIMENKPLAAFTKSGSTEMLSVSIPEADCQGMSVEIVHASHRLI